MEHAVGVDPDRRSNVIAVYASWLVGEAGGAHLLLGAGVGESILLGVVGAATLGVVEIEFLRRRQRRRRGAQREGA
ncbi:MAG: hypothetical protein QOI71_295 [Gaiellales bacterium]|jgi:hypothetical protein|nr:hypothetical protein [Gaiellales bacterium]